MSQVHRHYLVTGYIKEAPSEDYLPVLNDWFKRLVEKVNMKVLFEPVCLWCNEEGNEGVTGVIGLTTSHSAIHFWGGDDPYFQMDLYSCAPFSCEEVNEMLKEFGTYAIDFTFVNRDQGKRHASHSGYIIFD